MIITRHASLVTFVLVAIMCSIVASQDSKNLQSSESITPGPICDSQSFIEFAKEVESVRQKRMLSESDFARLARDEKTIILDARSEDSFRKLRIKGSKNLPYTSFSDVALKTIIPDRSTKILIYCRNNLMNSAPNEEIKAKKDRHPYPDELGRGNVLKNPRVALNIPTYITLMVYGYDNVWQLDALLDPNSSKLEFESKWPEEVDRESFELFNSVAPESNQKSVDGSVGK